MFEPTTLVFLTPLLICVFWSTELLLSGEQGIAPKRKLAFFMLCGAFAFLGGALYFGGYVRTYSNMYGIISFFALAQYPALYLYLESLRGNKVTIKKILNHYSVPVIVGLLAVLSQNIIYTTSQSIVFFVSYGAINLDTSIDRIVFWTELLMRNTFLMLGIYYFILIRKNIKKHLINIKNYYSDIENIRLNWVKVINVLFLFMVTLGMSMFNLKNMFFPYNNPDLLYPPFIVLTGLFWMIGFMGNRQKPVLLNEFESQEKDIDELESIKESFLEKYFKRLEKLLNEKKVYLNPTLTLQELALELGTNRSYVSKVINQKYNSNFNKLINLYRIKEAEKYLNSEEHAGLSLKEIAHLSGFNSNNSFIRNFKSIKNISPSTFRERAI